MLHIIDHPLIAHELTALRCPSCGTGQFRQHVRRIASLMVPSVTQDFATQALPCQTPLEQTEGRHLSRDVILVPILRAGLGFVDGFLDMLPNASIAHVGIARNERTLLPEPYYLKHPPHVAEAEVLILDPMLATGGSAVEAVRCLVDAGATSLRFVCLVAAPEGISALTAAYPQVRIFTASLDRQINAQGYILPGLGDAGDRLFGTA